MRRSKSDPAKYARNYRKISQRRMTQYDHIDEDKEMERLRLILKDSKAHLKSAGVEESVESTAPATNQSKRKRSKDGARSDDDDNPEQGLDTSILSNDLLEESYGKGDDNALILPSKKKKKLKQSKVQLTSEEIREAKTLQKKTARKLQQLETRAAQKKQRTQLYKKLEEHQISSTALGLLSKSGTVSRKDTTTKKQKLQQLIKRERAGIKLNDDEKELLYPEYVVEGEAPEPIKAQGTIPSKSLAASGPTDAKKNQKKKKSQQTKFHPAIENVEGTEVEEKRQNGEVDDSDSSSDEDDCPSNNAMDTSTGPEQPAPAGFDFASHMMASLTTLKKDSDTQTAEAAKNALKEKGDNLESTPQTKYVPSEPVQLKTAAQLGIKSAKQDLKRKVLAIKRPELVEKLRLNLPVSAMEFEIMDAIRNNDVTIICGETGSGKSTQIPQYLYENGMCSNEAESESPFLVGITQPRRVAAVSTAKRVCYEMGCGDGQTIKSSRNTGNMVSYKTRYETAGVGKSTRVQFMTDGILLQEIQSDLLLRRYSVIVLDESHERNLNTDVLIGLLSVALPLRKKASEEDPSLVPLKLVLMSATLRVEDFTNNDRLFPMGTPAVVNVPGRTHPVTIHHSKITELDEYESVAYKKIVKIHRKLPQGGILVFLTGKGEIIRMVNKLRRSLNPSSTKQRRFNPSDDVNEAPNIQDDSGPREMDDEELDAEDNLVDDYDDMDSGDDDPLIETTEEDESNIPRKTYVLPLYSLLSADEQAKVFAPVPEGHRLIVVATNIAETSITIPGISYVVDTGRQKCRNYNSGTGVASYDVMWISRAAADQRAGRAGRTGPGHCYRMYSSSLYSRQMDGYALPEVLTRPLEDVVLAMKSLNVTNVSDFPFPTPPDRKQVDAAVKLLANIGCVDVSNVERDGGDGSVTRLGKVVAKLPLGVRYAKMLLVAAQAGVLDYAIVLVSVLSENSPFQHQVESNDSDDDKDNHNDDGSMDEIDKRKAKEQEKLEKKSRKRWQHRSGDVLAAMLAVGAYTYTGRGAGGASEQVALRKFCEENGLNPVIMSRIQKMRRHLATLAKNRMSTAAGIAAKTGGFSSKMTPPNKLQERLLVQSIVSGLLDNVALLAPPGSITGVHAFGLRSAYLTSSTMSKEPLFMDRSSTMFSRDFRQLPQWICYDSVIRKTMKDGTPVKVMKNITPVDPVWLGELAKGTKLLSLGAPLVSPPPMYDGNNDAVLCAVSTKFGSHGWEISPARMVMYDCLQTREGKHSSEFLLDDSYRWFARFLFEGKVVPELEGLVDFLNDRPIIITKRTPVSKVSLLVSALAGEGVDSASALRKHWAENDDKFLFKNLKNWVKRDKQSEAKKLWIKVVKDNVVLWKNDNRA